MSDILKMVGRRANDIIIWAPAVGPYYMKATFDQLN